MTSQCPSPETLFTELEEGSGLAVEHAGTCPRCTSMLEAHRALEQGLFQLRDPAPPENFVSQVMSQVAARPITARREALTGLGIFAAVGALLLVVVGIPKLLSSAVSTLVVSEALLLTLTRALAVLWRTAATPVAFASFAVLVISLWAVGRVSGGPLKSEVSS